MHSVQPMHIKRKQRYAIIMACLLNLFFLLCIFLLELNKNMMLNTAHDLQEGIVVTITDEKEADQKKDAPNTQDGLMIRGNPNSTVEPTLFSDYLTYIQSATDSALNMPEQNSEDSSKDMPAAQKSNEQEPVPTDYIQKIRHFIDQQEVVTVEQPSIVSLERTTSSLPSPSEKNKRQRSSRKKRSSKTTPSLVHMTRQVFNTMAAKGNAAIYMAGDPHKNPSELQLIEEHYWSKVERIWQNSFALFAHLLKGESQHIIHASMELIYQPDGLIGTYRILRSSGNPTVDQVILDIFADALPALPPKPTRLRQLNGDIKECNIRLYIN